MSNIDFCDAVPHILGDSAEAQLKETKFLVEATSCETHDLWAQWCGKSQTCREPLVQNWRQLGGWAINVGTIDNRPIVVQLDFASLDGFLVCMWTGCSTLVDYDMITLWLEKHFTAETIEGYSATCDAMNFHNCLIELQKFKKTTS